MCPPQAPGCSVKSLTGEPWPPILSVSVPVIVPSQPAITDVAPQKVALFRERVAGFTPDGAATAPIPSRVPGRWCPGREPVQQPTAKDATSSGRRALLRELERPVYIASLNRGPMSCVV